MAKSRSLGWSNFLRRAVTLAAIVFTTRASADEVLQTTGFNNCNQTSLIVVHRANIRYNNSNKIITFDVAGTSTKVQNVTAVLEVTAYGQSIYSDSFNPCDDETFVNKLCPGWFIHLLPTRNSSVLHLLSAALTNSRINSTNWSLLGDRYPANSGRIC